MLSYKRAKFERGDIPKSIKYYMHEIGATEEKAKAYIYKEPNHGSMEKDK